MLKPSQERVIEHAARQLTSERQLFGESPSCRTFARDALLLASGRDTVEMEWGSVLPSPEASLEFLERLTRVSSAMARLSRRITIDGKWGCWGLPLKQEQDEKGRWKYPLVTDKAKGVQSMGAHRYTWKLLVDPDIPTDDYLDHLCRVHACCNITHLEPVSSSLNAKRGNDARHIIGGQNVLFYPE